jgi:hypothetical protein
MLYAFVGIGIVILIVLVISNAYAIWYAKSGRYELDRRLNAVAKR